jgi:hypothetical protein
MVSVLPATAAGAVRTVAGAAVALGAGRAACRGGGDAAADRQHGEADSGDDDLRVSHGYLL